MQERRKSGRSRVLKGAKLLLGTSSVLDCIVRNATNTGARVQIANTVELPDPVGLTARRRLLGPSVPRRVAHTDRDWCRISQDRGRLGEVVTQTA